MIVIAGLTIISFVYFLDPTTGRRGGRSNIFSRGSSEFASINGRGIGADEYEQARSEARLEKEQQEGENRDARPDERHHTADV